MGGWKKTKIGEFLIPYRIEHIVQNDKSYGQVTISKNYGISFRGKKLGKNIGRKRQFVIDLQKYENTVLFTRQGILDGAIGIAPKEVDGCIVTENMPMMKVDTDIIEVAYLKKLLLSEYLFQKIRLLTVVGSAQKSIHERDFLEIEIEIPQINDQRIVIDRFESLDKEHSDLKTELTHQQTLLKKLRQQILQEAIEGKLTEEWRKQNPNVEPAGELLKRIQTEKAQLIKEKKIKKQKPLPPISEDDKPFDLPEGWVWCRLGEYALFERGKFSIRPRNDPSCFGGEYPFIQIGSLDSYGSIVSTYKQTLNAKGFKASKLFEKDTVMVAIVGGTIGNLGVLGREMCFPDSMVGVRPNKQTNQDYILMLLRHFRPIVLEMSYQMAGQPNIKLPTLNNLVCALPPVPEQKAIVAKVEKLLAACDQLEAQTTHNQTHANALMQAVLKEAFTLNGESNDQIEQVAAHA